MVDYPETTSSTTRDRTITRDSLNLSSLIREGVEPPVGIKDKQVMAALCEADGLSAYQLTGMQILIGTKKITKGPVPYVMLLIGFQPGNSSQINVISAYRIYDRELELDVIAKHPMRAFLSLLLRFGTTVTVGSQEGKLIPDVIVDVEASTGMPFIAIDGVQADPETMLPFLIGHEPGSPSRARVRWAYALRTEEYRMAVSARCPVPRT